MGSFWLMKAEPDSRIVKGKDVKFSVDDFQSCRTTAWEGVRNHEAKNIMRKQMKIGDKVFFYHSNCKNPGIAAIAEANTADDPTHPYYDPKSASRSGDAEPTWWMVELAFGSRLKHFVPLSLLRLVSSCSNADEVAQLSLGSETDHPLSYLTAEDLVALKKMPLLNRGRLSVQSVNSDAWAAIIKLAEQGGWGDTATPKRNDRPAPRKVKNQTNAATHSKSRKRPSSHIDKLEATQSNMDDSSHGGSDDGPRRSKRLRT
ncbi:thymocyte nuclear protein 1 [Ceratobasidium sp. AG-Ba]|nr:thymocyte nuclear protein 1 [Ceratobasidium sp. AG-Ba]